MAALCHRRSVDCRLVFLLLVPLLTCSEGGQPPHHTLLIRVDDPDQVALFDDGGMPIPPPGTPGRILVVAGEAERTANVRASIELGVLLYDSFGDPVEQERVSFELDDADPDDAQLSALNALTDSTGHARVELRTGSRVRDLKIRVSAPDTRVVDITVHVVELPTGGLEIEFEYVGPIRLGEIEVYLIENASWCDDPSYLYTPEHIHLSEQLDNPAESVVFDNLLAGRRLSIMARATRESNGVIAAGACFGDVTVPEHEIRRVTLPLFLLPLNPAGTYTVESYFDFTGAIPGTLGSVIDSLVRFFGDGRGEREVASVIFEAVEQLIREAAGAIPGLVVHIVSDWIEDELNDIVNGYIDNDGPEWLRDFFRVGSDVMRVVSNQEVISQLHISKPRADGTFVGSQSWVGIAFYWRLDCTPDSGPECGRHAFTMDQIVAGLEGVNAVFGQFEGRVHSYNQCIINQHAVDLQYGRLILFVLNHVILPRIAEGADNLTDALENLANCPAFADRMTNRSGQLRVGGFNIASRDRIEGWCTTVMVVVGDLASAILARLRIDTHLSLDGQAELTEEDNDLIVDGIEGGVWRGVLRTGENDGSPVEAAFSGDRAQ